MGPPGAGVTLRPAEMPVPEARFRSVLAHLAGGVAVVTSVGPDGAPCGLTATAVCSVSLDPPLVLASIDRGSHTHGGITGSGLYAINLLSAGQEDLAGRFATERPDKFAGLDVETDATGAPLLRAVIGYLDCTVVRDVPAGDHTVFLGRVEAARLRTEEGAAAPLVYHLGRYRTLESD